MKISEILNEAPRDIKLLVLLATGYDINQIRNRSDKVKNQFKLLTTESSSAAMKNFLMKLNLMLIEISQAPHWEEWTNSTDGKSVMREIERLYADNIEFMKKH